MANDSTEYQGSQAYAQTLPTDESVAPNSGSVGYSRALVALRGKSGSTGVSLKTAFSSGTRGSFGFPPNWGLDISFTIPHKSLTVQGRTYVVDADWSDQSDYHSGLRYINHHGIKFERVVPSLPLPSGRPGWYGWRFTMADGATEYFDEYGKLLEHADLYGNSVCYAYTDEFAGPRTCRLDYIKDTWDQTIRFEYDMDSSATVICPDGSTTTMIFGVDGIDSIKDPLGHVTTFTYRQLHEYTLLDNITSPTGMLTQFDYLDLPALDHDGNSYSIPACSFHTHKDADGNELDRTQFTYGDATNFANFSGSTIGCRTSDDEDSLMESNNQDYRYDVAISRLAPDGSLLQMSRVFYNYLHLSITEEHYLVDSSGGVTPTYQTVNTFDIPLDQAARATTFSQPVQIEYFHYISPTDGYRPMRQCKTSYTSFGNITSISDAIWDLESKSYMAPHKTSVRTYVPVQWGGEMLETQVDRDGVVGQETKITYTLSQDQRNIASTNTFYRENGSDAWLPWKTKLYHYDGAGRITSETLAWSPNVSYPAGSVASFTFNKSYSFDSSSSLLTVTNIDALGAHSSQQFVMSVANGPLVRKTSPLGNTETFKYDLLGRLIEMTDALGHVTATTYSLGSTSYRQTRTALGYVTRTELDMLGRETRVLDNGHDGADLPSRVLVKTEFDAISRIVKTTDVTGLAAYRSYDALSRMIYSKDIYGNVSTKTYDDVQLTTQQRANGDLRIEERTNALGQVLETILHGDSIANPDYQLVTRTAYTGYGKVLSSSIIKRGASADSTLQHQAFTYDLEGNPVSLLLTSAVSESDMVEAPGAPKDQVRRDIQFDIFGNSVTYTKTASYHDGRVLTHAGPISRFDACNRLVSLTNQLGQAEVNKFDADGHLTSTTRYDGSVFTFKYDQLGQQIEASGPDGSTQSAYLSNGRLSSQTCQGETINYEYSLDGCATAIKYPGDRSQRYLLDTFSRVAHEIDTAGVKYDLTYDDCGRLMTKESPVAKVHYTFGTSNHTMGILLKTTVANSNRTQVREHRYDAFSRVQACIDTDSQGRVALSSVYARDARGRTIACEVQSTITTDQNINYARRLSYDGLGQLTKDSQTFTGSGQTTVTEYKYDGNYNVVHRSTDGQAQSYSYNALDQRVDAGFKYDTNARLIADAEGRSYVYDSHDRLLSVSKENTIKYAYHPDGSLASRSSGDTASAFYHDGGTINCIGTSQKTDWTSYMTHVAGRAAATNSNQQPTLLLESQDSTVLSLTNDGETIYASSAYGQPSSTGSARFGWKQELVDDDNGLVYLRSRYYSPEHRMFITMDSSRDQENRYAFCNGDPINLHDSSGHEGEVIAAAILGNLVGILVTVASGGALVEIGVALSVETNMTAVGVAAATISGAAGSLAGDATSAIVRKEEFTWTRAGEDLLSGAIGGAIGAGSGGLAAQKITDFLKSAAIPSLKAMSGIGIATSMAIGGGAGAFSSAATSAVIHGESIFSSKTAFAALQGAAMGGAGGALWASESILGLGSLEVIPRFLTKSELDRTLAKASSLSRQIPEDDVFLMTMEMENVHDFGSVRGNPKHMVRAPANDNTEHFTIVAHGDPSHMYASVKYRGRTVYQPVRTSILADAAERHFSRTQADPTARDIKLLSCSGAKNNAQTIANRTGRRVWAAYGPISVRGTPAWHLFTPRI